MKNNLTIILLIVILLITAIGLTIIGGFFKDNAIKEIKISTEKNEYKIDDILKLNIENNLEEKACFSSENCFPFYLEKKNNSKWEIYLFPECKEENLIEKCIETKEVKGFELISFSSLPILESIESGIYRIAVPICENCNIGDSFNETQRFYSNEFEIK
ncbi:MAG: hypothetical protein ABH956_03300 [Candidatus Nealsonbacteria bacterium]